MANNFNAFKGELQNLLATTTNIDNTTKQKMRDRCVAAYPADWAAYLAQGNADNANNRGKFLVEKTVGNDPPALSGFWRDIWRGQSQQENIAAAPPPDLWA